MPSTWEAQMPSESFLDPGTCFPNPNPTVTKTKAESLSLEPTCRDQDLHAQQKAEGRHGCVICRQTETIVRVPAPTFQQNLQRARGQTKTGVSPRQLCYCFRYPDTAMAQCISNVYCSKPKSREHFHNTMSHTLL